MNQAKITQYNSQGGRDDSDDNTSIPQKDSALKREKHQNYIELLLSLNKPVILKMGAIILIGILFMIVWRNIYNSKVIRIEHKQKLLNDIEYQSLFISSDLIEYKRKDVIEDEIKNKHLNLKTSETPPFVIYVLKKDEK